MILNRYQKECFHSLYAEWLFSGSYSIAFEIESCYSSCNSQKGCDHAFYNVWLAIKAAVIAHISVGVHWFGLPFTIHCTGLAYNTIHCTGLAYNTIACTGLAYNTIACIGLAYNTR